MSHQKSWKRFDLNSRKVSQTFCIWLFGCLSGKASVGAKKFEKGSSGYIVGKKERFLVA